MRILEVLPKKKRKAIKQCFRKKIVIFLFLETYNPPFETTERV